MASVVTAMLGPGDEAEDVGQETFLRFYGSLDRFRGDAAPGTYLTRIAINLSRNALRRERRRAEQFTSRDDPAFPVEDPTATGTWSPDEIERRERAPISLRAISSSTRLRHRSCPQARRAPVQAHRLS